MWQHSSCLGITRKRFSQGGLRSNPISWRTQVNKSGSDIDITGDLNPNILMCKSEIFKDQGLILITLEHMARARELLGLHPTLYEIGERKYVPNLWTSSQSVRRKSAIELSELIDLSGPFAILNLVFVGIFQVVYLPICVFLFVS